MKVHPLRLLPALCLILMFVMQTSAQDTIHLPAGGVTFKVNTRLDTVDVLLGDGKCADASGKCSLRAAVMESNRQAYPSTIDLPAGVYQFTIDGDGTFYGDDAGDLNVVKPVSIIGGGAQRTTIDVNNLDRAFEINTSDFKLYDVEIKNGNVTNEGGALYLYKGHILLDGVYLHDNAADWDGGAIYTRDEVSLTIENSTIYNNSSGNTGAGLYFASNGLLNIENSTFSTNQAVGQGGGLYLGSGSTINLYRSTVAYNTADLGGGFRISNEAGAVNIAGTLIAKNSVATQGPDCYGEFTGLYNLVTNVTDCTVPGDTIITTNEHGIEAVPVLDRFGTMPVHVLSDDSLGADVSLFCSLGQFDQVGVFRALVPTDFCSIGAVEPFTYPDIVVNGGFEQASATNPSLPDGWKTSGITTDKMVCNNTKKLPAYRGNCAMQFNGAAGKKATLKQSLDAVSIPAGAHLLVYAYVSGKGTIYDATNVSVKLTLADESKQKIIVQVAQGNFDYLRFISNLNLADGATVTKAKLAVGYSGATGSITVDDVKVIIIN